MSIPHENLSGLAGIIGAKNRAVKDILLALDSKISDAMYRADGMKYDKVTAMQKLEKLIYNDKTLKDYFTNNELEAHFNSKTDKLGIKEMAYNSNGEYITDFDKMSYSDIISFNQTLKNADDVLTYERYYSKKTIRDLQAHCKKVIDADPQLQKVNDLIFEYFDVVYEINNERFSAKNGVDLGRRTDYIPRVTVQKNTEPSSGGKKSITPPATQVSSGKGKPDMNTNIMNLLSKSWDQAITYNAFEETNSLWNRTLNNTDVKSVISKMVLNGDAINKHLGNLYEAYPEGINVNEGGFIEFAQKSAVAKLMANFGLFAGQASSATNSIITYSELRGKQDKNMFTSELNYIKDFTTDYETWTAFTEAWKDSKPLKYRVQQGSSNPYLEGYMNKGVFDMGFEDNPALFRKKMSRILKGVRKAEATPIKGGDIAAFIGAKPIFSMLYKENLKTMGKVEARDKALADAYKSWVKINQSVWGNNASSFQVKGIGKLFAYFTTPTQMGQQRREGLRNLVNPSSTGRERIEGAKKAVYYSTLQTAIFMASASVGKSLVKTGFKFMGKLAGYDTDPEEELANTFAFFDAPENEQETIAKIIELEGFTQGTLITNKAMDGIAAILRGGSGKEDIVTKIATVQRTFDLGMNVVNMVTDKYEKKQKNKDTKGNKLMTKEEDLTFTPSEIRTIKRFVAASGDFSGHGFSVMNRYREWFKGEDIIKETEYNNPLIRKGSALDEDE